MRHVARRNWSAPGAMLSVGTRFRSSSLRIVEPMTRLLVLAAFLTGIAPRISRGQTSATIAGVVNDAATGAALSGATVRARGLNPGLVALAGHRSLFC